ncbi:MAG: IS30 family transposase [Comamonadaceae bacterium]|nr:IS30 family transposase [Comamonadaceae bacterium]
MKETRKYEHLSYEERSTIALGLQQGMSVRAIARALGRSPRPSVGRAGAMRRQPPQLQVCPAALPAPAQVQPPTAQLAPESTLFKQVCRLLRRLWSPEQIAGHLATVHGTDQRQRVSHESIYTCIYAQPKGELRRELIACLRMARAKRWPRSRGTDRRGEITDLLSIHVRPPQVNERQFPGHWEGDLIKGAANLSAVGSLVERSSRLLMLVKLPHPQPATAAHVLQAFSDKLLSIAQPLRQTLTYDRGKEMACHRQLSQRTGIAVYFCDPHSPWQRGTNENTNGLVRQYLPKGTDLSGYSQEQLDAIADEINNRPRKTLGWASPIEVYRAYLDKLDKDPLAIQ